MIDITYTTGHIEGYDMMAQVLHNGNGVFVAIEIDTPSAYWEEDYNAYRGRMVVRGYIWIQRWEKLSG